MKVELEELDPCRMKMDVEIPAETVKQELDVLYRDLQKRVQLKGFRKGKAPRSMLAKYYKRSIEEDLIKKIVPDSCLQVIQERDIKAVGLPKVDDVKLEDERPLKYTAVVDIIPSITISEYRGMEFTKRLVKISPQQIDRELERLREIHARVVSVDRPAQMGDHVVIRYQGALVEENFPEGEGEALVVAIGSGRFLPEVDFESQLIGLQKGDQKEVSVSFPKEFRDSQMAGKDAIFRVWVEEVKVQELSEVNDEFAREIGNHENMEDLRAKLLQELEEKEKRRAQALLKQEILDRLIEQNSFPIPDVLAEEEVQRSLNKLEDQLRPQGKGLDGPEINKEDLTNRLHESALKRIRGELILDKIAETEDIQISDEDIDTDIRRIADLSKQSPELLLAQMEKDNGLERLRQQLRFERTLDLLVEQSNTQEMVIETLEGESPEGEKTDPLKAKG